MKILKIIASFTLGLLTTSLTILSVFALNLIGLSLVTIPTLPLLLGSMFLLTRKLKVHVGWLSTLLCLTILISMFTHWPLELEYKLAQAKLDQLANQVELGASPQGPIRIGLIQIKKAEVFHNGITCLWTDLDPGGYSGFVRCSPERAEQFNLWSHHKLDNRWQFITED